MTMFYRLKSLLFPCAIIFTIFLLSSTAFAEENESFFSEENVNAIKNDPVALFSAFNTCHFRAVIGKKDYDLFAEAMDQMTVENDEPGFVSVAGHFKGLSNIYEGFFRMTAA